MSTGFYELHPYNPPDWSSGLKHVPTSFVKISELNTPIHKWNLPDVPAGFSISIKRDDLTGAELSGSKVRFMQIVLAEALTSDCRHVVTGGAVQSDHCRSVSLLCRALGLIPHVVIGQVDETDCIVPRSNALLYRLAGSHMYQAPLDGFKGFNTRLYKMSEYVSSRYDEKCFCIPLGAATASGVFGSISAFDELLKQGLHEKFDDIVLTIGSGATTLGIALGNYLTGSKVKVHAVTILSVPFLKEKIDRLLVDLGVTDVKTDDILDVIDGYIGEGYGQAGEDVLDFIARVSSTTGILLDPCYTGKGAMGMMKEIERCPERFKGKRILFVHTGGIFGLFNEQMDRVINKPVTSDIRVWSDINQSPFC